MQQGFNKTGAQDWIRTSTPLQALRPEHSASTNFATWASPFVSTLGLQRYTTFYYKQIKLYHHEVAPSQDRIVQSSKDIESTIILYNPKIICCYKSTGMNICQVNNIQAPTP